MKLNAVTTDDLFSIEFKNGSAAIRIGEHINQFICSRENEAILSHMVDVIVKSTGLYGTDIVDFECVIERCTRHQFSIYPNRRLDADGSVPVNPESKAVILFLIGSVNMGLADVNHIIEDIVKCYSKETEIIFTAENSLEMQDGCYTLCVLE